ncbi:MAG: rhomboid family intramembrane serine protease [Microthrixaceae bacterium]|nr:rhomboid family intramembrane serine protease [Microthrixaceae bacterium]
MAGVATAPAGADEDSLNLPEWARPILVVGMMLAVMWLVEIVDLIPRTSFDRWGIQPREVQGLVGVVTMPFLHDGFGHLISNTVPFLILGAMVAAGGVARYFVVTGIVTLVAGVGVWLLGPDDTVHIGASALVFGYLTYLLSRGFYERKVMNLVVGLVVLFLYGGVLWGVLPRPGISWQGHLFGAVGGVLAARVVHNEAVTTRRSGSTA